MLTATHAGTVAWVLLGNPSLPADGSGDENQMILSVGGCTHKSYTERVHQLWPPGTLTQRRHAVCEPPSPLHQSSILPSVTWMARLHHNFTHNYADLPPCHAEPALHLHPFPLYTEVVFFFFFQHQDFRSIFICNDVCFKCCTWSLFLSGFLKSPFVFTSYINPKSWVRQTKWAHKRVNGKKINRMGTINKRWIQSC